MAGNHPASARKERFEMTTGGTAALCDCQQFMQQSNCSKKKKCIIYVTFFKKLNFCKHFILTKSKLDLILNNMANVFVNKC